MLTNAPRGTKDLLPQQAYKWHFVEGKFKALCDRYGFKEIRTPMFEHTELFQRGVGDTTDIVQKEMYTFEDHGHRSITLKPEGTSPVVRSFVEHKQYAESQPTKYYYVTPCFRYEKPQSGRLREFHQFGIEIFGTDSMLADAEVICLARDFLDELGIGQVELRINSVGCPECRAKHRQALKEFLKPHFDDLCEDCKDRYERNPMRIIDCKKENCRKIAAGAPMMLDYLCDDCRKAYEDLKKDLTSFGIEYTEDPTIVRGLDYYTKTAFEFVTTQIGAQGTVCGGGRYDNLIEEIGGPHVPGVGFGLGIERLLLLMENAGIEIEEPAGPDAAVIVHGDTAKAHGLWLVRDLRRKGFRVELDDLERNIKGQFKFANRIGARLAVVIGENERERGGVTVKNRESGEQQEVPFQDIPAFLSK